MGTDCAVPSCIVSVLETVGFLLVQPLLLTLHFSKQLGGKKEKFPWATRSFGSVPGCIKIKVNVGQQNVCKCKCWFSCVICFYWRPSCSRTGCWTCAGRSPAKGEGSPLLPPLFFPRTCSLEKQEEEAEINTFCNLWSTPDPSYLFWQWSLHTQFLLLEIQTWIDLWYAVCLPIWWKAVLRIYGLGTKGAA